MIPVSVCMIAKNEDNHMEECLKRLKPLKFEIIVVDTGSVDRTVEIAKKYTDKVFSYSWSNDFSQARNYSIAQASNDWILVIDCDEYMEKANLAELSYIMEDHPDEVGLISRNNPYILQGTRAVMTERIGRFFNRKHCHYEGMIHEQVKHLDGSEPSTYDLPITLYHEGYVSESEKRTRATRNLEMLLRNDEANKQSPYIYSQMAQNYLSLHDLEKAIFYFEKGLSQNPDPKALYVQEMVETYAYCLLELEKYDQILELVDKYQAYIINADIPYIAGMAYYHLGKIETALAQFKKAVGIPAYFRAGVNSYRPYYQMGLIYEERSELAQAKEAYEKCGNYDLAVKKLQEI